jgi:hypothetical protein
MREGLFTVIVGCAAITFTAVTMLLLFVLYEFARGRFRGRK